MCDDPRIRLRQLSGVADRPDERDDEQEQGHRGQCPHTPGERAERRDEREHVAVEVCVERQQRREVGEDERREDLVGVAPLDQREDQSEQGDEERRPHPLPEAVEERDRRRPVVLEAEPAAAAELLHAANVSERRGQMDDEERARHRERKRRERGGDREPAPLAPTGDDERHQQDEGGVLEACGDSDRDSGGGQAPRDHQPERDCDSERHRHIRDGHPGVRDVRHLDGGDRTGDEPRHRPVRTGAEPPRSRDSGQAESDHDEPAREVRRVVGPALERRDRVHEQGRVVEPLGIEPTAMTHVPGARDDALLVRVEKREGKPVLDADEADRGGADEECPEGEPPVAPPARLG